MQLDEDRSRKNLHSHVPPNTSAQEPRSLQQVPIAAMLTLLGKRSRIDVCSADNRRRPNDDVSMRSLSFVQSLSVSGECERCGVVRTSKICFC